MCQSARPVLVQVLACRLFGAKPLPEPVMTYICWMTLGQNFRWISNQNITILTQIVHLKMLAKWRPFYSGLNLLDVRKSPSSQGDISYVIWRHWTYHLFLRYFLPSVCLRLIDFPQLSFMQYIWVCVFSQSICLTMIVRIYVLYLIIIIKLEIWIISHYYWLGHETMHGITMTL